MVGVGQAGEGAGLHPEAGCRRRRQRLHGAQRRGDAHGQGGVVLGHADELGLGGAKGEEAAAATAGAVFAWAASTVGAAGCTAAGGACRSGARKA